MDSVYVALDLETTGLNSDRDAIIEVAAVRFAGDTVLGVFETLVRPTVDLPLRVQQITGLAPGDLAGAPPIDDVLPELLAFVGGAPLVGHSVDFDLRFLRRQGAALDQPALDTFELASIVVPEARRYGLGDLIDLLNLEVPDPDRHRALSDAQAHRVLFLALCRRVRGLPADVLAAIGRLAERVDWALGGLFVAAARGAADGSGDGSGGLPPLEDLLPTSGELPPAPADLMLPPADLPRSRADLPLPEEDLPFSPDDLPPPLVPVPSPGPLDIDALAGLVAPGGPLAARLARYEDRPGQREMLRKVAEAFEHGDQILVEAGTGIGKRLAYLLPAAAWARAGGRTVTVAARSPGLREQLVDRELPLAIDLLGGGVRTGVLKGREHYLCRRRLAALAARTDLDVDAVRGAARVLIWSRVTRTGDRAEILLQESEEPLWRLVNAAPDVCAPDRCAHARAGGCWFPRAHARASASHVVVVDHALLVEDALSDTPLLPRHDPLIVDEAHRLEDAATTALGAGASQAKMAACLASLGGPGGILARARDALAADAVPVGAGRGPAPLAGSADAVGDLEALVPPVAAAADRLFRELAAFVGEHAGQQSQSARLTTGSRRQPGWSAVEAAWDDLAEPLAELGTGLGRLREAMADASAAALVDDLAVARREVDGQAAELSRMISRPKVEDVVWATRDGGERVALQRVPLVVDAFLAGRVFAGRAAALVSSTLRAGDDFEYVRDQVGLRDAPAVVVPSPFDYMASTLVCIPTDMPEPEHPGHQKLHQRALVAMARALGGRMLVLYTSYGALKTTYHAIRKPLGDNGVVVLGQGLDGSRHNLISALRDADRPTVVLGTFAFWEGVDIPGPALSALVITRLPFGVSADPVYAARSELYDDPFRDFAVPHAVLRFRQGFGRLIRTATDRGVLVVLDGRVHTKTYGWMFLDALPPCQRFEGPLAALPGVAARFVDAGADGREQTASWRRTP